MNQIIASAVLATLLAVSGFADAAPGPLPMGRWTGWLKIDSQQSKLAAVLDTYLYQPEDITSFPRLNMTIRIGLGGYSSAEYVSQVYEDVHYDFDHGTITLDSEENDIVLAGQVQTYNSMNVFEGTYFSRASSVGGTFSFKFLSDEPDDDPDPDHDPMLDPQPYKSTINGQYEGKCGNSDSIFQIETFRGMGENVDRSQPGLIGYSMSSRLGYDDARLCSTDSSPEPGVRYWCTYKAYTGGNFNFYTGSLILNGWGGTTPCTLIDGDLSCRVRYLQETQDCRFRRVDAPQINPPAYAYRRYNLNPSSDQLRPLPDPMPPENTALIQALTGAYSGYLHHELTDKYQPMKLNLLATTSSENPHIPNMVYISGAFVFVFGAPSAQAPIWAQRFDRKAFYVKGGFTLDDHNSDAFLQITRWSKAYVEAVLYSRAFGRVGTVQLLKGSMPSISPQAVLIPNPLGEFEGPITTGDMNRWWWFQTVAQTQTSGREKSTFSFKGEIQTTDGIIARRPIDVGAFDFYSGAIAFTAGLGGDQERSFSGNARSDGMNLLWPGVAQFGIIISPTHTGDLFQKVR